jgi:hypothetical protein
MVELTELNGVAEGRAENLTEAGYESVEDLVGADYEAIAEQVNYLPEDTALELVVQAENLVEEEQAEVVEDEPATITEEVEEAVEEATSNSGQADGSETSSDDETSSASENEEELAEEVKQLEEEVEEESPDEDDGPRTIEFEISFNSGLEYDTFFDAVMGQRATMLRTNRTGVETFDHALKQMRNGGMGEPVELSMTEAQLNGLHNSVREKIVDYKGDNLIDHMDALQQVMNQIDDVRSEELF